MRNTTKRVGKFTIIGIVLSIFNFLVYTFLARIIFSGNELLWLDSMISYALATILAYLLHSKITWKERFPGRSGIIKFFIWNFLTALLISPFFTWLFGLLTPLYQGTHQLSTNLNLPFDYNFIESTFIFYLVTLVTMILNYLFYDKLVFGTPKNVEKTYSKHTHAKVSVIVPIYNTEKYLPKCLDSILNQTHENLEIILVDDGSTDDSGHLADIYAKKDKRIKVIHQKNQGQSTARNTGLEKATGDYISFVDSDDQIKPTFIESLLSTYADKTSLSVCGVHYKRLKQHTDSNVYINPLRNPKNQESKKAYILYLLAVDGRMYSSVNKLFRASIAKKCQFDKTLNFAEDTKYVLDYLKKAGGEIAFVLEPLYIYNFGTETSTIKTTALNWQNWQTSYKNLKSWLGPHPTPREKFWLHTVHLRWRISYLRSKRRAKI
ncbi:glycosyltransferase [Candidatus Saccharibacteria bacterium]|nr:glycosyltransferase [Candidatus Saccharibacteria bacterium]